MKDQIGRRLLFLATVLSVVLCVGGCGIATEVEDDKTVFTFPTSFLVVKTLFCLVLGLPFLCGVIGPIVLVAWRLHSAVTPSARQQEAAERTKTGTKTDEDEIGWARLLLMLLMGPLIGSYFLFDLGGRIHSGFNDKVILSDSGFISDVWIGFELHRQKYSFKDIRAIRTGQMHSSGKGAQMRRRATITLKSGQQEAIPVNDLLRGAWPEIARKAVVNGIHIEGDF